MKTTSHSLRKSTIVFSLWAIFCLITGICKAQSVTITAPANPTSVPIGTASLVVAADAIPTLLGAVNRVTFDILSGTTVVSTAFDTSYPYTTSVATNTLALGSYTLRATMNYTPLLGSPTNLASATITINIIPTAPTAPTTSTCPGSTANITVSGSSPAGGTYSLYTASTGGTALSSTTGSTLTTPVINATTTYYVGYNVSSIESNRTAVTVTTNAVPASPTFTTVPSTVAPNGNVVITLTSATGPTYTWDFDGGTPATGSGNGPFNVSWAYGGIKTITATATNANGCISTATQTVFVTAQTIASSNFAFSQPITLNSNISGGATPLSNFPALVYIQEDALKSANCSNNIQFPTGGTNGYDFAFTTVGGTNELFYEVESFNAATGTLLAWVQVPSLNVNAVTNLTFYFGSKTPGHPASFAKATWANDYLAVYHFNESSGSGVDATAGARTATPSNVTTVAGKITSAYNFNGTNTRLITTKTANITGSFTLSAWINVNSFATGVDQKIITNQLNITSGGYKFGIYGSSTTTVKAEIETRTATGAFTYNRDATGGTAITTTAGWIQVQAVYNGTNFITYYNGVQDRIATGAAAANGVPIYIGSDYDNVNWFNGSMDEIRVSNVAKPADWIKAEYVNQNNYIAFTNSTAAITVNSAAALAIGGSLPYTWTGTGGTATTTAGSWIMPTSGNPTSTVAPATDGTSSFIIPNTANKPSLSANAAIYGLTIASGTSLSLNSNTLTVGCNIYNSGTINTASTSNVSNIIWNGTFTPQLYVGNNTVGTAQFGNMTVNNTAASGQVKITGGPIDLYNTLTLTSGSLVVDNAGSGALTLKSSGTVTARVDEITSTSRTITGNVTVERWFTGGALSNRGWRLMSSPVNNTATVPASASAMYNFSSLKTNLNITGSGTNFDASANNGPTILFYNTATKLFTWPSDPTTTNRNIGSGFYFYFRGSRTGANKLVKSGGVYPTPEVNVVGPQTGALNQHSFSYTLSNANAGFNQVGNPYPSSISMMSGSGSGAGTPYIGTTGFVYTYVSNANSITLQPTAVTIASGQGFFVKSNSATSSINFTESLKTANQPTGGGLLLGKPTGTEVPIISFKMVQDSANYDIAHLRFLDTYKNEYDEMEDADDLNGPAQNVFFGAMTSDKHLVAIASQPMGRQRSSVFLSVNDNFSGTYSIEKMNLAGIPEVYDVWLMDHFKNDSLDLKANSIYKFNMDKTNPKTFGNSRFEVVLRKKSLPPYRLISFKGQRTGADVLLKWNTLNEYDYTAFELQKSTDGKNFEAVRNMQSSSQGTYSFKDIYNDKITTDIYYRLKQTDINDNVTYSDIIIISTQGNGSFSIFPNPATNVIQYSLKDDIKGTIRLKIYNSMGMLMKNSIFTTTTGGQDVSSLTPGGYTIELTDNNSKKTLLTGKFIKL